MAETRLASDNSSLIPTKLLGKEIRALAIRAKIELLNNHEIPTWSIPVFVFTLELIVKAVTSFTVYW